MAKHRLFKNFETVTIISPQGSIQAAFVPKRGERSLFDSNDD